MLTHYRDFQSRQHRRIEFFSSRPDPVIAHAGMAKDRNVFRTRAKARGAVPKMGDAWPPEAGLPEQASNRPVLLHSKGTMAIDRGKVTGNVADTG